MTDASIDNRSPDSAALHRDEIILALQARESFLDQILGSLDTFFTVGPDWRLTFVNRAAAQMAGATPEELTGRDLWEVMPDATHGESGAHLRRAMAERSGVEYEMAGSDAACYHGSAYPLSDGGLAVYMRDVTEARRRESEREDLFAALEQSEQSFAAVFEASPFAMSLTVMPSGEIVRVNRAFEELFGYPRQDLIGHTSPDLGLSDAESQAEVARRFGADGVVRDFEVQRTTRGGDIRTLSLNLDWITLGAGKWVLTSVRDITLRAQAEEALRQSQDALRASERLYRSIVETTGDGIVIGEPDGRITFANQRMADMLGYTLSELTGLDGGTLVFPDWQPAVAGYRSSLRAGEVVRGEFKLRRKDGSPLWTVFSSTPMHDERGGHTGNLTMHSDISELKAAEHALRRSEERFRLVLGAAPVTVAAQDKDLRFVWAFNQRTAPSNGVIGKTDLDIFAPGEAERLTKAKRQVLEEGVEVRDQMWLDRPQGRVFLDCTFTPLFDDAGEVIGVGVTTVDLTPMQLAEEARRESERTLRSFFDSAPFLMGVVRLEGDTTTLVSGNRALGELLGTDAAAIAEDSGIELGTAPEFEAALVAAYRESEQEGRAVRFEQPFASGEAEVLYGLTVAHIGVDAAGRPLFSFVAEDVTDRRRAAAVLREAELAAAAQDERSRLARDLHDSVTQALFAASLKAEALAATDTSPAVGGVAEEVRRLSTGALAQMRTMLLELRGEPLENIPIRQLLRNAVEAIESRTHATVELSIEGADALDAPVHAAVFRITQEALNNVVRHAHAKRVRVELHGDTSYVRLMIADDGDGFDVGAVGAAHLGLRSMRERAAETGGRLHVESAPGRGTELDVVWRDA